jgi:hypothetical protein
MNSRTIICLVETTKRMDTCDTSLLTLPKVSNDHPQPQKSIVFPPRKPKLMSADPSTNHPPAIIYYTSLPKTRYQNNHTLGQRR